MARQAIHGQKQHVPLVVVVVGRWLDHHTAGRAKRSHGHAVVPVAGVTVGSRWARPGWALWVVEGSG